jgi:hypothetical protein
MRWRRLRKWAKWTCTVVAVLAVGQAVVSRFFAWDYHTSSNSGDSVWTVRIGTGQVLVIRWEEVGQRNLKLPSEWRGWWESYWYWGYPSEKSPYDRLFTWHAGILYSPDPSFWVAGASVLYPVAVTLIPAALLWYADRRRFGPGLCTKCGYDRRGLAADAKCPECGTVPS